MIIFNLYGTGISTNHTTVFCGKYKHLTTKLLKRKLKQLKISEGPSKKSDVSHLLPSMLKNQDIAHSSATTVNQGRYVSKNFWGFAKHVIEKGSTVLPRVLPYLLPTPLHSFLYQNVLCSPFL